MRSLTDVLDDPSVVGIDDEWIPADYKIDGYVIELFDDDDKRVWRVSSMPVQDSFVEAYHTLHYGSMRNTLKPKPTVVERIKLLLIQIRNFYLG